jgi:regulator of cell morphogenesis and NO signaling
MKAGSPRYFYIMYKASTISEIVRNDYRTAEVFKKWGINFCCGGNILLAETCSTRGLDQKALENDLQQVTRDIRIPNSIDYDQWPVEFLIDYILNVHHAYLYKAIPQLQAALEAFVPGHLKKYPYLDKVKEAFEDLAAELKEHMRKEELVVFPYIKQVSSTLKNKEVYGPLFVRLLKKSLDEITVIDHLRIEALLLQLRQVTDKYSFTENACTRHQVIYRQLREVDDDLVQHKHLENNILFPKGLQLEKQLLEL